MKRILIIRPDNLGDFVIFSGVLKYYADLFKDYKIDLICKDNVVELAQNCPYIDRIIPYNKKILAWKKILKKILFKLKLKKITYNKVIYPLYSRSSDSEVLMDWISADEKIVFDGNFVNDAEGERFKRNKKYSACKSNA